MDAIKALKTRRSRRKYLSKPVDKKIIEDIIDCARLAATARNVQPWKFVIVTDDAMRKRIASIAEYGKFIADAPVCIAVFCENTKYYLEDGCAATENILLASNAYGLGSCWVAGDKKPYAREISEILNMPDNYRLISLISVGYSSDLFSPVKKELKDVIIWEKFLE